jgi:hypothetical protein
MYGPKTMCSNRPSRSVKHLLREVFYRLSNCLRLNFHLGSSFWQGKVINIGYINVKFCMNVDNKHDYKFRECYLYINSKKHGDDAKFSEKSCHQFR